MIAMNCPECGTAFGTASALAGKTTQCPHCKKDVPVPLESQPELVTGLQQTGRGKSGDGVAMGCLFASGVIFLGGTVLWLFRPPSWGIPGIVCFIIMAIGLAAIKATWGAAFPKK